jgi:hypothetical protein
MNPGGLQPGEEPLVPRTDLFLARAYATATVAPAWS